MSETLFELIGGVESSDGYLTDTWLDRLRAFEFSPQDGAQFLAWLPNIKPHLACCTINRSHGETDLGSPADFIEFHTGGWSGAEELIAAMLEHFWIRYFHTKWSRGGHYTFEIPTKIPSCAKPSRQPSLTRSTDRALKRHHRLSAVLSVALGLVAGLAADRP